jgi:hypothetical protein
MSGTQNTQQGADAMDTITITIKHWLGAEPTTYQTLALDSDLEDEIFSTARGSYQKALLEGYENWSGSSLRGAASHWGARYAASRGSVMGRLRRVCDARGLSVFTGLVLGEESRRWETKLLIADGDKIHVWD